MFQPTLQILYYRQSFGKYMGYALFGGWGLLIVGNKGRTLKVVSTTFLLVCLHV